MAIPYKSSVWMVSTLIFKFHNLSNSVVPGMIEFSDAAASLPIIFYFWEYKLILISFYLFSIYQSHMRLNFSGWHHFLKFVLFIILSFHRTGLTGTCFPWVFVELLVFLGQFCLQCPFYLSSPLVTIIPKYLKDLYLASIYIKIFIGFFYY